MIPAFFMLLNKSDLKKSCRKSNAPKTPPNGNINKFPVLLSKFCLISLLNQFTVLLHADKLTHKNMKTTQIAGLLILMMLFGCSEDNEDYFVARDMGYYPVETGKYNQYEVTEINIDAPSEVYDTIHYQLKELIGGSYTDNEGQEAYMFVRYKRQDTTKNWSLSDVWSLSVSNQKLFLTEENLKYVKIYFPVSTGKSWDGNAYNTLEPQTYEITGLDRPETINNFYFDSVLTVTQEADSSLIHKDLLFEQYARDTGLIYKEITRINSQEIEPGVPVDERITTGSIYRQKFVKRDHDENFEI